LNLAQAVKQTAGKFRQHKLDEAENEAVVLICHLLQISKANVYAGPEIELTREQLAGLDGLVQRRLVGEPAAYIVRHKEFYGIDLYVDQRVLIPRPETEVLVEETIKYARDNDCRKKESQHITIADAGTGSGAIAIALARRLPHSTVYAVDISRPALEVAAMNVERQHLKGRIILLQGDLLEPVNTGLDIVVANPPYIASATVPQLAPEIAVHEPRVALDGGESGTRLFRGLVEQARQKLNPGGALLMEIGQGQDGEAADVVNSVFPGSKVSFIADLQGIKRVIMVQCGSIDPGAQV